MHETFVYPGKYCDENILKKERHQREINQLKAEIDVKTKRMKRYLAKLRDFKDFMVVFFFKIIAYIDCKVPPESTIRHLNRLSTDPCKLITGQSPQVTITSEKCLMTKMTSPTNKAFRNKICSVAIAVLRFVQRPSRCSVILVT